jgi:hypothetical protein
MKARSKPHTNTLQNKTRKIPRIIPMTIERVFGEFVWECNSAKMEKIPVKAPRAANNVRIKAATRLFFLFEISQIKSRTTKGVRDPKSAMMFGELVKAILGITEMMQARIMRMENPCVMLTIIFSA